MQVLKYVHKHNVLFYIQLWRQCYRLQFLGRPLEAALKTNKNPHSCHIHRVWFNAEKHPYLCSIKHVVCNKRAGLCWMTYLQSLRLYLRLMSHWVKVKVSELLYVTLLCENMFSSLKKNKKEDSISSAGCSGMVWLTNVQWSEKKMKSEWGYIRWRPRSHMHRYSLVTNIRTWLISVIWHYLWGSESLPVFY